MTLVNATFAYIPLTKDPSEVLLLANWPISTNLLAGWQCYCFQLCRQVPCFVRLYLLVLIFYSLHRKLKRFVRHCTQMLYEKFIVSLSSVLYWAVLKWHKLISRSMLAILARVSWWLLNALQHSTETTVVTLTVLRANLAGSYFGSLICIQPDINTSTAHSAIHSERVSRPVRNYGTKS